jgi:hypothetical protein
LLFNYLTRRTSVSKDDPTTKSSLLDALVTMAAGAKATFNPYPYIFTPPSPPPVQFRWFKDETIHIDGYTFDDCRFDGCTLVTEMATFGFHRCYISPNCRVYFQGMALKIVRLLMHVLRVQARVVPHEDELGVYATINKDGTFTLE